MNCKKHHFAPSVQNCLDCGAGLCKLCSERFDKREAVCGHCCVNALGELNKEKLMTLGVTAGFLILGGAVYIYLLLHGTTPFSERLFTHAFVLYGFVSLPIGLYSLQMLNRKWGGNGQSRISFVILPIWIWFAIVIFFIYIWLLILAAVGMVCMPFMLKKMLGEIRNHKNLVKSIEEGEDIKEQESQLYEAYRERAILEEQALKGLATQA